MQSNVLPIMPLVFGGMMLIVSVFEYFFPSKSRNQKGYRTRQSLFTQESWDFAQKYYAKMLFRCSLLLMVFAFLSPFIEVSDTVAIIIVGVILLGMAFFIYFITEKALREKF